MAAAFGIETRIDDAGVRTIAFIAATQNDDSIDLNGMTADKTGTVTADGGRPGFFFPGVARVFPAQPYRDRCLKPGTAAQILCQLRGAPENVFEARLRRGINNGAALRERLSLLAAFGQKAFQRIERRGIDFLFLEADASGFKLA